ncbi:MAG: S-layer protein [Clostridia bacterium]|jgi:beta-N-acetylhexosaminidase|nr:S-layer protein [Clostridia bacterium]
MKRYVIIATILIIFLLSSIIVFNNYIDKAGDFRIDIRGTITNININGSNGSILVEGKIESDTYNDKASVRINENTLITKPAVNKNIDISELKVGDRVEVTFIGPVAESYPVQATGKLVRVIE